MLGRKIPLLYFSLEITFQSDYKLRVQRYIKRLEKLFHRKADFTIIQDKYRLKALMDENKVQAGEESVIIVPNSSMGKYDGPKSRYFRDMFSLADDDVIVLHAGGIGGGYMNTDIAATAADWPGNWKLIFHFSMILPENNPEIEELRVLSKNKALFSFKPVPFDKLAEITSSADIGIVYYSKDRGPNYSLIVGASGKLSNYLRCGLPVIALSLPGFKELFDKYNCGVVVDVASENKKAVETILSDYDTYSKNASRCFNEAYEFESHFSRLFPKLKALAAKQQ
jgi:glycosyltransferase involved in cell wall biosynthesis